MCMIDFDPCEVWDEREVKARKAHACDCCHGTINPGEKYLRHFHVFEGDASSEKMCLTCSADRDEFGKEHNAYSSPKGFRRDLAECINEGDEESEERWRPMLDRIRGDDKKRRGVTSR